MELPLRHLFETPTVEALAQAVQAAESPAGRSDKIARVLLRVRRKSAEGGAAVPYPEAAAAP